MKALCVGCISAVATLFLVGIIFLVPLFYRLWR